MNRWIFVALIVAGAAIFSSPGWAKDNPTPNNNNGNNGNAYGQAGDGNPQYKWSPATDAPGIARANEVIPPTACGNSVNAAPGRCPLNP